jgi:hypothetical protein
MEYISPTPIRGCQESPSFVHLLTSQMRVCKHVVICHACF